MSARPLRGHAGVEEDCSDVCTVGVDMKVSKAIFAFARKYARMVSAFKPGPEAHNGRHENVQEVCCDMSPAFVAAFEDFSPTASEPASVAAWTLIVAVSMQQSVIRSS